VKRTMFKSMITKNVISETKKWFLGYEKMMQVALQSNEHIHNRQKRQRRRLAVTADSNSATATQSSSDTRRRRLPLPPCSEDTMNSPSSVAVSQQASIISSPGDEDLSNSRMTTTSSLLLDEKQFLTANDENGNATNAATASLVDNLNTNDDNDTVEVSNPQAKKDKDVTKTILLLRVSMVLFDSLGSFFRTFMNTIRSLPSFFLSNGSRGDGDVDYSILTMPVVILSILLLFTILFLFLLQMNISMHTSIVSIEKQLQDVHTQNTILLKRINDLSSSSSSSSS